MQTSVTPSHHQISDYLTETIISEMTQNLMDDFGYSIEQALDTIYNSKTISLLQQEDDELYVQSPSYVYDLLLQEKRAF